MFFIFRALISISEALQYDFIHEVYFPQRNATAKSSGIFVAIEVEESEIEKLNLPEGFVRLAKAEKQGKQKI